MNSDKREALIGELSAIDGYVINDRDIVEICQQAAAELQRLTEAIAALSWVSVDERLPEDRKAVLVWVPHNQCHYMAQWFDGKWHPWAMDDRWWTADITHWKPLPPEPQS